MEHKGFLGQWKCSYDNYNDEFMSLHNGPDS